MADNGFRLLLITGILALCRIQRRKKLIHILEPVQASGVLFKVNLEVDSFDVMTLSIHASAGVM